ncbi:methylase of chemotaxis methyl-accepting protein [Rheinheimera sp. A13L]|uniref:chemotaxis protein CheB n=1 Tax=Rheinheimera sp. A13L TaxID=506534 RepID=UPI0002124BDF|nr:chemotaxis protein CheB [Rheinheimera sp. A13L]EGM78347.1 methylase of chemotaxis methyl-accepting protein [Rheinheimera sp. A13L]
MSSHTISQTSETKAIRIVGIGASAGGLEALNQFLAQTPADTGLAWIVVQHLDPTKKALLPELLQRVTTMPVQQAIQGMQVQANHLYVIPPDTELTVVNGSLHLAKPEEARGLRLPVDVLFSSLASALGEKAIAVVLSGMGSDGTTGVQAIKAVGGLSAVQKPDSAQFDSMPSSVINAGFADIIDTPAELPGRILAVLAHKPEVHPQQKNSLEIADLPSDCLQQIVVQLQRHSRHDFSSYKTSTLLRRIERRMAIHSLASLSDYAAFLHDNPQELDLLFKELLIGVTHFFREPAVWQHLSDLVLPELLQHRMETKAIRAWCIGCSTGEEACSLAITFCEVLEKHSEFKGYSLQIFASDLSPDAIASARRGQYPLSIAEHVSAERLERFFVRHESCYQIKQAVRDLILYAQHDVILDAPFTRLDLIVCRNLLIYFDTALQRRLLPLFHYSLRDQGILLLGSSETTGRFHDLFTPVQAKLRLYQRQPRHTQAGSKLPVQSFPPLSTLAKEHPVPTDKPSVPKTHNLQNAADQLLLQVYSPAAVVLNSSGDIVYISGRTGKYLEPAAGKANWNFHAMAREGLRAPLATALKQASQHSAPLQLRGLTVSVQDTTQRVDVTVQALREPSALQGMTMIVFRDVAGEVTDSQDPASSVDFSLAAVQQQYLDEIQLLREETQASKEELQSSNEELQSTNEELQSTNEELTTSKEEMQSMNEELQTINTELQTKLDDLALAQSDLQNTLNSIEIAVLFLDQQLNVRRYTDRAAKIINLRESDLGRPLTDLTSSLMYPGLHQDAQDTLRTLVFSEKQIPTSDERWFTVRIMPYRRLDNVIDGVVITLVDISTTKKLEAALREQSTPTVVGP